VAELFDKISILEIKKERIFDESKLSNIELELRMLTEVAGTLPKSDAGSVLLCRELKEVNKLIWDGEEMIRCLVRELRFDADFVSVAEAIHKANDRRASIKKQLNLRAGSVLIEEKSHELPRI